LVIAIRSLGGTIGLSIYKSRQDQYEQAPVECTSNRPLQAPDNAIFNHQLSTNLAPKIAEAVIPFGLPKASVGPFIAAFASGDTVSLGKIEGFTPTIIGAAVVAQKDVYSIAFRNIWITAGCFTFVALIGQYNLFEILKESASS
jgi:hypothetical protein